MAVRHTDAPGGELLFGGRFVSTLLRMRTLPARVLVVVAALALGGCGSSGGATSTPAAASPSASAPSTPAASPSETPSATPTPTPSTPAPAAVTVKKYGGASAECAASSAVLMKATTIGGLANQGKVTQADFEKAFSGADVNGVPIDAVPILADLKTASLTVVGLDAAAASAHLGQFADALGRFTTAVQTICS